MAIPTQHGINAFTIFTSQAPGGTPPPASQAGNAVAYFEQSASGSQPATAPTLPLSDIALTDVAPQYLAEFVPPLNPGGEFIIVPSNIMGQGKSGAPSAGQPATPLPIVYTAAGQGSTGNQPAVNTPFTDPSWSEVE